MQAATLVIAAATVTLATDGVTLSTVECEADHQCGNGYCYPPTGMCTPCTNCLVYLRNPPDWKACPKSAQDCGDCTVGFQDDILTDGSKRDFCVPVKTHSNIHPPKPPDDVNYILIGSVIAIIIIFSLGFLIFWKVKKGAVMTWGNHVSVPTVEEAPPPPYNGSAPLLMARYEVSDERVEILEIDGRKETYALQQAVPFIDAVPPYTRNNGDHHHEFDLDEEDEIPPNPYLPSSPPLDDEDTVPSFWTPGLNLVQAGGASETITEELPQDTTFPTNEHDELIPTSSTSSLSDHNADGDDEDPRSFNDSGLSASCSKQSSSTSLNDRPFIMFSKNTASCTVAQRCRSEEDVGQSYQPSCKKAKIDSGSASMASVAPDSLEDDNILSGNPSTGQDNHVVSI